MTTNDQEQKVGVYDTMCKGRFNYDKLVEEFGVQRINNEIIVLLEQITGQKPHRWLRREIFFAHRALSDALNEYVNGRPFYLYTGRGPSTESLHLGHMLPFEFTAWLQQIFKVPTIIQISDEEKYYVKDNMSLEETHRLGIQNSKDIIAVGFIPELTFIFSHKDFKYNMDHVIVELQKLVTLKQIIKFFGSEGTDCIGKVTWPISQSAPAFHQSFSSTCFKNGGFLRCVVVYAIDQDPYFRLCRKISRKLPDFVPPCSIMSKFLIALKGESKMSSTANETDDPELPPTIFMNDTFELVLRKFVRYAFSGGRATKKEHQELGADLTVDVSIEYLRHFEEDDDEFERICQEYRAGRMFTKEVKELGARSVFKYIERHQQAKYSVTDEIVNQFYEMKVFNSN